MARVYAAELRMLRELGFIDTELVLPILVAELRHPLSQHPEFNGVPSYQGMQRVLAILLGQ